MLICMESLNYDAIVLIKSTDAREMVAFLFNFSDLPLSVDLDSLVFTGYVPCPKINKKN